MTVVEELVAKLGLEVDEGAFGLAEKLMEVARGGMMAIGAAAVAAAGGLAAAVAATASHADAVEKAAQRTGIGVEALQALQYAAERADVGAEGLQGALNFMAKRGVKDFQAELGRAADELAALPDGGAKAARAMQLFGKQGAALIPMLNGGSAGLEEMTQKARDMGLVLGKDMVESGAETKDAIEDLQGFLKGLVYLIAGPLLKPVREWLTAAGKWIKANREIIGQNLDRTLTLVGRALGYVLRLIEPVVDISLRLNEAIWQSKAAMLALGAVAAWLALPFLAPVAAIGLLLMAVEEVWGWVTGKRATLLEDELGSFDKFKASFDVINPEDSGFVVTAKLTAQFLRDAYDVAVRLRDVMGFGPPGTEAPVILHGSAGKWMKEHPDGQLPAIPGWRDPRETRTPEQVSADDAVWEAAMEVRSGPFTAPAAGAGGNQTIIGSITVQAPPGSTAQNVVDLIKAQIGIAQRAEYVTALPAVSGP